MENLAAAAASKLFCGLKPGEVAALLAAAPMRAVKRSFWQEAGRAILALCARAKFAWRGRKLRASVPCWPI